MDVEYWLNGICFGWDRKKATANIRKHGVDFRTACEVFFDPFVCFMDSEAVDSEERDKVIGVTAGWEFLVVVFVDRRDSIRLVSARSATRKERQTYEDH